MEPDRRTPRQVAMPSARRAGRILVSLAFALGLIAVPIVQVAGCSCAIAEPAASIRDGQLAFIGTVVDRREVGRRAQRTDIEALLPVIPMAEDEPGLLEVPASLLVIGAAVLLLGTVGLVAFRRTAR
jgi:hypothetical protein